MKRRPFRVTKMLASRAMYRFENACQRQWPRSLWTLCYPMSHLRWFTEQVLIQEGWFGECMSKPICVEVVAADGIDRDIHGKLTSVTYKNPDGFRIELSRSQRRLYVLLHELAHVFEWTANDHGPTFAREYANLLSKYGGLNRIRVVSEMRHHGVRVK